MKKIIALLMVLMVFSLSACDGEGYKKTGYTLDGYDVYEKNTGTEICASWYSILVYEGEEGQFVYLNECPTVHAVKVDDLYIPLTVYIGEHQFTYEDIKDFPLFIQDSDDLVNSSEYKRTTMFLKGYPVYVKTNESDICAEWESMVVLETDEVIYSYFNHCPVVYYLEIDEEYIALESIIYQLELTEEELSIFPLIVKTRINEDSENETNMILDGHTVYMRDTKVDNCAMWYSMVIYSDEEVTYVFHNYCPVVYYLVIDNEEVLLTTYIFNNNLSLETIESFPLFIKSE